MRRPTRAQRIGLRRAPPGASPTCAACGDFRTITPLERPARFGETASLTADEASKFESQELSRRNKDRRVADGISAQEDVRNAYNQFWWDYGSELTEDRRTSLVVVPSNGRIPALTATARARYGAIRAARARAPHGPEDRGVAERLHPGIQRRAPVHTERL